jgi:hypothetical protein
MCNQLIWVEFFTLYKPFSTAISNASSCACFKPNFLRIVFCNVLGTEKIGIVLLDSFQNTILKKLGLKQAQEEALDIAVENGLYRVKNSTQINWLHMFKIILKCLSNKTAI